MEEYDIDDDLVEAYVMSGDVQPYESEPEPAAASGAPVVMKDGNSAGHHEGGADADGDIMDEDSPVFLTAVSHTTESDAVGGEGARDVEHRLRVHLLAVQPVQRLEHLE